MVLLRSLAVAVLLLASLPGTALGVAQVERNATTGIISIVDNDDPVDVTVTTDAATSEHVITSTIAGLNAGAGCTPAVMQMVVRCPLGSSFSVNLNAGGDTFIGTGVTVPLNLAGGPGIDKLTGGGAADVLAGGNDGDMLEGGGGVDDYFGEDGNDTIEARDGLAERISCGAGTDTARNDFTDIIAECETGVDGDADGFGSAVDCNDTVARIHPGAAEVFENGIDEDCDGRDNVNLDRDGDGFIRPVDCDDGNRNVRPNTPEVRGNNVDENCDNRAAPFAQFATVVSNRWAVAREFTLLRSLVVRNAPAGARIVLRCEGGGCPIDRARRKTVRRNLAKVVLHRGFKRARLRPGARLLLSITAKETIGRFYSYTVKSSELPTSRIVCRDPGKKRGRAC